MLYSFAVANGDYTVNLHFAETWSGAFGDNLRVFDVTAEGQFVLDDLDIYTEVRENRVLIKSFPITVTDGKLNIEFLHVVQNPKVCAIEIVQQ